MPQALKLSIPEPCTQDWNVMTPAQQGRHCSSCNKVVIDFTTMSDAQIVEYFKSATNETCGRMLTSQINRSISVSETAKRNGGIKYIAVSMLVAQLFSYRSYAGHDVSLNTIVLADSSLISMDIDSCATVAADSLPTDSILYDWPAEPADTLNLPYAGVTQKMLTIYGDLIVCGGIGMQTITEEQVINPWYKALISPFLFGGKETSANSEGFALLKKSDRTLPAKPHPTKPRQMLNWLATLPRRFRLKDDI